MPQWPWSVYSHMHTSVMTVKSGYRALMARTAKYASAFYGPFRAAAGSAPSFGDRKGYQMDPHNRKEALRECALDAAEGADILMVKPALSYLDVIRECADAFDLPLCAYSVSGEYAMIKAASARLPQDRHVAVHHVRGSDHVRPRTRMADGNLRQTVQGFVVAIRRLNRETRLSPEALIYPIFVDETLSGVRPIESLPGQNHAPARAWLTAIFARRSRVSSLSTSWPWRMPQWPWSVYAACGGPTPSAG